MRFCRHCINKLRFRKTRLISLKILFYCDIRRTAKKKTFHLYHIIEREVSIILKKSSKKIYPLSPSTMTLSNVLFFKDSIVEKLKDLWDSSSFFIFNFSFRDSLLFFLLLEKFLSCFLDRDKNWKVSEIGRLDDLFFFCLLEK